MLVYPQTLRPGLQVLATASHYWPLDAVDGIHELWDQIGNRPGYVNGSNISMCIHRQTAYAHGNAPPKCLCPIARCMVTSSFFPPPTFQQSCFFFFFAFFFQIKCCCVLSFYIVCQVYYRNYRTKYLTCQGICCTHQHPIIWRW